MNFIAKWFVTRKLESLQKDLQQSQKEGQPMKMSPAVKAALVMAAVTVAQYAWSYYQTDTTPTWREGLVAVGSGLLATVLFWVKSGRLPSSDEVHAALTSGSATIEVHNDDPKDPVVLKVDGKVIPSVVVQ